MDTPQIHRPSHQVSKGKRITQRLCGIAPAPPETPESTAAQARFVALGETASDLICELDHDFRFVYLSPNYRQILHYKPAKLLQERILDHVHPQDVRAVSEELDQLLVRSGSTRMLFRFQNGQGEWRWLDSSGKAYCAANGNARAIFISRDVTEQQDSEEKRALLAARDPATLLFNKQYFVEQLIEGIEAAKKGAPGAVVYVDLDQFKRINDRCGHLAGDRLIVAIANVLHEATPKGTLLTRFGGDEFLYLLGGLDDPETAIRLAEDVRVRLAGYRFIDGGNTYVVSASVGVAPVDGTINSREVLNRANAACAAAKALGGNRVEAFRECGFGRDGFREVARRSQELLEGLARGRVELWYQPVVHTGQNRVAHYEALIRLRDADGSVRAPSLYLPSAERFGYLEIVDRYVTERAVRHLACLPDRQVAVILSGQAFMKSDMTALILDTLRKAGVSPERLIVQIPWEMLVAGTGPVRENIGSLKNGGVRVGIKHFRGDIASVQCLRGFPVDYVTLDGELMRDFLNSKLNQATVSALNEIGHALQVRTIAEFVDDQPTLDRLLEMGIDFAKGDLIGTPQSG